MSHNLDVLSFGHPAKSFPWSCLLSHHLNHHPVHHDHLPSCWQRSAFCPGAGGIKLSCALSTSSPHNHHMLPQHIIHHYSHYQVGDHSFNLCEFSSHAIPTTVKSIIFVSFQKHAGLGSKPFFASIVSNNKYCESGWFLRYSYYSSVIHSCI